jgi:uncharacterized membrane protein YhfC
LLLLKLISILTGILAGIVLPVGAAIGLSVKRKGYMKPVLLGALTFFVFQIVTRIPLLQLVVAQTLWFRIFAQTQPVLYALFLGGTAALFEEGGRWIVMTLFMKNKNRLNDGIAFGVGHGGIEAVYILGIGAVALLLDQTQPFMPADLLWGSLERVCTMVIHIAWSVMVLKSVVLKKPLWLLLAFVLHTAIDMVAVLMPQAGASVYAIEAVICIFALALLAYILFEHKKDIRAGITPLSDEL